MRLRYPARSGSALVRTLRMLWVSTAFPRVVITQLGEPELGSDVGMAVTFNRSETSLYVRLR